MKSRSGGVTVNGIVEIPARPPRGRAEAPEQQLRHQMFPRQGAGFTVGDLDVLVTRTQGRVLRDLKRCSKRTASLEHRTQELLRTATEASRSPREQSPKPDPGDLSASRLVANLSELISERTPSAPQAQRPMRVVLMGKTTAGKSTLYEALTQGDGGRRGEGGQRTTRTSSAGVLAAAQDIQLVDVPGVGAADGEEDVAAAFAEAASADLIMWVASNDSQQQETVKSLVRLGLLGKPILLLLNCKQDLRTDLRRRRFLERPDGCFKDSAEHLAVVRDRLLISGVEPIASMAVHAEAAFLATTRRESAAAFAAASRVDELLEILVSIRNELAPQLHAVAVADGLAGLLRNTSLELAVTAERLTHDVQRAADMQAVLRPRQVRLVDGQVERLTTDLVSVIQRRRAWYASRSADPRGDVERAWKGERKEMNKELESTFAEHQSELQKKLERLERRVEDEFRDLPDVKLELTGLPNFGASVWLNRVARVSLRTGEAIALGAVGAKIGALLGAPGGPPGIAVGLAIGAVLGLVSGFLLRPIEGLIDRLFRSEEYIVRKRRERVRKQLSPLLDKAEAAAARSAGQYADAVHGQLRLRETLTNQQLAIQRSIADELLQASRMLNEHVSSLDLGLTRRCLTVMGRSTIADGVRRVTRSGGILVVADLNEPAYSEFVLFPPVGILERLAAVPSDGRTAGAALAIHAAIQLVDGRIIGRQLAPDSAQIELVDDPVPEPVIQAWSDVLTTHCAGKVSLSCGHRPTEGGFSESSVA